MMVSGCVLTPDGRVAFQPVVVVGPAPVEVAYSEPVMVPETYVWDGYENVGLVGGQYFYLGPGNIWVTCEPYRLERFHGWEGDHRDWQEHAVHNDRFRNDRDGRVRSDQDPRARNEQDARARNEQDARTRNVQDGHVQPGHGEPQNARDQQGHGEPQNAHVQQGHGESKKAAPKKREKDTDSDKHQN